MAKRNFLLGKGEILTSTIKGIRTGGEKYDPYTFKEAKERLQPMLDKVASKVANLPADSCPDDYAVAAITLNPEYIAKSYYPDDLFRAVGVEAIGSKGRRITPAKRSVSKDKVEREPVESLTTEIFVMGKRHAFTNWARSMSSWTENLDSVGQIIEIEEISFPESSEKVKISPSDIGEKNLYEIVLHLNEDKGEGRFLAKFQEYLKKLNLNPDFTRRFYAGGLCFVEVEAPKALEEKIAEFSLVRVLRKMPQLRLIRPEGRSHGRFFDTKIDLPDLGPIDPNIKVAIFDGGIPDGHALCKWVTPYETEGLMLADAENIQHGVSVTSAFLFGHIDVKTPLPQPYSYVDHYRVLDDAPGQDPYELFEILERIKNVLATKRYDFINLSLGPWLPIDDDEVHSWTAVLDEYLSDGATLTTIAVGNDGDGDVETGANRIQVPSDCVNALAIGACDSPDDIWGRATYSSIGPGRSPGLVKPDLVDFGGEIQRPFITLNSSVDEIKLYATSGTSFSSPSTLRLGCGVRAHFGNSLNALAIRALLVHCSETADIPRFEIGWGRVARHLEDIVVCEDHVMRVVYQGTLTASKFMRVPIPLPNGALKGSIKVTATLVFTTPCDPHHSGNYTRSGLDVYFRPNNTRKKKPLPGKQESIYAETKPFFTKTRKAFQTEEELRRDAWKWENCQHATNSFQSATLVEPSFDIHYNARSEGRSDNRSQQLLYALVITVEAPRMKDLYNQVVRKYATKLEQLRPVVDVPIKIKGA